MRKRQYIPQISPEVLESSTFPVFARFYFDTLEGNSPYYKDGAIPFFIKFFDPTEEDILEVASKKQEKRRVPKGYLFDKFYIYKMADYGAQSLSPTFDDMIPLIFDEDGYKVPLKNIMLLKNYTMKQAFAIIPKSAFSGGDVSVIVEPKSYDRKGFDLGNAIPEVDGTFSIYLDDRSMNSPDTLNLYIKESNGTSYFLSNSDYFITKVREDFPSELSSAYKFVEEQGSYFLQVEKNFTDRSSAERSKVYPGHKITINPNIVTTGKTIHAVSTEHFENYYYNTVANLTSNNAFTDAMRKSTVCDVYKDTASGQVKMIAGYEYYLTDNNSLAFTSNASVTNDTNIEVHVRKDVKPRLQVAFETDGDSGTFAFNIKKALYDNFIANWDVDVSESFVAVFEDGKLVGDHTFTSYDNTAAHKYIYSIEEVSWSSNTTDLSAVTNDGFDFLEETSYSQTQFNKYQMSTDPFLTSYGGTFQSNEQEVHLYDDSLNFKLDSSEPYITDDSGTLTIQGIADPYAAGSFLTGIKDNYQDFQSVYQSGKTKLTKALHDNAKVQSIEAQVSQLKKNLGSILANSSVSYTNYTSSSTVSAGSFLFLVLKGTSGQKFNLAYKDGSSSIIKKEYNCTFDSNGRYISVPFFLDTFGNDEATISFQVEEGTVQQYHIFK